MSRTPGGSWRWSRRTSAADESASRPDLGHQPVADLVADAATVDVLKALAHPVRLRILAMLRGGELCLCQMTAVLDLAASTVSAHLADLKRTGLVGERKDGRWVFHRLAEGEEASTHLEPVFRSLARDPQVECAARLLRELRRVEPGAAHQRS